MCSCSVLIYMRGKTTCAMPPIVCMRVRAWQTCTWRAVLPLSAQQHEEQIGSLQSVRTRPHTAHVVPMRRSLLAPPPRSACVRRAHPQARGPIRLSVAGGVPAGRGLRLFLKPHAKKRRLIPWLAPTAAATSAPLAHRSEAPQRCSKPKTPLAESIARSSAICRCLACCAASRLCRIISRFSCDTCISRVRLSL